MMPRSLLKHHCAAICAVMTLHFALTSVQSVMLRANNIRIVDASAMRLVNEVFKSS